MRNATARALLLVMTLILMTSLLLINSPAPPSAKAAVLQGPDANLPPKSTKSTKRSNNEASARERARAESARRRREQAEAEAEQEREEQERREREQMWMVAWVCTCDIDTSVSFQWKEKDSWNDYTLAPHYRKPFITRDTPVYIKFQSGTEEKQYVLEATRIVGHYPTESEKENAKVYEFKTDADGILHLYAK